MSMEAKKLERAEGKLRKAADAAIQGRLGDSHIDNGLMMLEALDGDSELGRMLREVVASFDTSSSISAGLEVAKARGKTLGRPATDPLDEPKFHSLVGLLESGESARAAAIAVGLRASTACKWLQMVYGDNWVRNFPERKGWHDNDSVYCWKVTSASDDVVVPMAGYHLVKFGVTSNKLGDRRIEMVAGKNGMGREIVAQCDTCKGDATYFESELLKLGTDAGVPSHYDGYTEFRIISDDEMEFVTELLGTEQVEIVA